MSFLCFQFFFSGSFLLFQKFLFSGGVPGFGVKDPFFQLADQFKPLFFKPFALKFSFRLLTFFHFADAFLLFCPFLCHCLFQPFHIFLKIAAAFIEKIDFPTQSGIFRSLTTGLLPLFGGLDFHRGHLPVRIDADSGKKSCQENKNHQQEQGTDGAFRRCRGVSRGRK